MEFFDEIFECIAPSYRKIEQVAEPKQMNKQQKKKSGVDGPQRSLAEITEKANAKITQIR